MTETNPHMNAPRVYVERTLAVVKPDAVEKVKEIEDIILRSGFTILQKRTLQLSPAQCSDFYAEHYGKAFFPSLTAFMSSGPIIALALARENAIAYWRSLMGPVNSTKARESHPHCLRARYGDSELRNALHGSDNFTAAEREIKFMFPNSVIEPIPVEAAVKDYLNRYVNPTLHKGLTELCKNKPADPFFKNTGFERCTTLTCRGFENFAITAMWLADWLMKNNPNKPGLSFGL